LFTDIEGSTRLVTELGDDWLAVLSEHHELVGGAIAEAGGFVDATDRCGCLARAAVPCYRFRG
jgi:class 3 adenylate cyclase